MLIKLTSVFVDDQEKALKFYTKILGFEKKADFPVGKFKWLTVVSPEAPDEVELLLEPNEKQVAKNYQKGLCELGLPALALATKDIQKEHLRLKKLGVRFTMEPTKVSDTIIAIFDDTCGNLVQIYQI